MRRTALLVVPVATVVALTSGCGVLEGGLQRVPLPGGVDTGESPYQVIVEFSDVLELVPQSLVKVNDVSVGTVTDIVVAPQSWNALVTVELAKGVELPANATARVRTTSLLGEKFVELAVPETEPARGRLADGDRIPVERTTRATEVEEVLGALSLLLNGGGVAQIRTIAAELNRALEGNEPEIRALLTDLETLVSGLEARKGEITRALEGLNRLSGTLAGQRQQIATALDGLPAGLGVLADQRTQLVGMLEALDQLSGVAVETVNRSREDVLADLELLRPTLQALAAAGEDVPNALEIIATHPFTDGVTDAFQGDYANLFVDVDLDLGSILSNLAESQQPLQGVPPELGEPLAPSGPLLDEPLGTLSDLIPPAGGAQPGGDRPGGNRPTGVASLLAPLLGGSR